MTNTVSNTILVPFCSGKKHSSKQFPTSFRHSDINKPCSRALLPVGAARSVSGSFHLILDMLRMHAD